VTDNEMVALIVLISGATTMVVAALWAFVKLRVGRKPDGMAETLQSLEQRFARVEVAIDDLTGELHRVSESNGFLTRLLSERSREPGTVDRH
jgi:hypothetical protein